MFDLIPLGTGSALPSRERHFSATVVEQEGRLFLFDCGEGTQYRFLDAGLRMTRLEAIFITHLHGDHYFGLPGLISTLTLLNHTRPLTLVGPTGLKAYMEAIPSRKKSHETSIEIEFLEIDPEAEHTVVYETEQCRVTSRPLHHSVQTAGYRFEEGDRPGNLDVERAKALGLHDFVQYRALKDGVPVTAPNGRRVAPEDVVGDTHPGATYAYLTDTMPCEQSVRLAEGADLVYHEATFLEADRSRAIQTRHATAREAATIAREAGARHLLIGHFSGRYKDAAPLVREAREVFKNTDAAKELKRYTLDADVASTENLRDPF